MSPAFRLGLFIIVALLILSGAVFWIGSKQFLFSSTYTLNAEFDNAAGLTDGAEVRIGGIPQGTIKRKDLPATPEGKVRIVMSLKDATREVIRKDSVATIKSEGLVGDKFIEIAFGSSGSPKVQEGDTIRTEPPVEIGDLIQKANEMLGSASQATEHLESISAKINRGAGTLGALVNDRKMYQEAVAGVTAFKEDMDALKRNFLLRGFFKNRGYEDSSDLTKDLIQRLPAKPLAERFTYDGKKLFDKPDNAKLENTKALGGVGNFLETNPYGLVVVAASTDQKGDSDKDRTLTQARAKVVRDYLVQNFKVDDKRVKTIGLGKSGDAGEAGRIDILIYPAGAQTETQRKSR
jgi:phospholipid/cholesterol/gamma-HCH transport system substrate-binding protein